MGSSLVFGDCHASRSPSPEKEYTGAELVVRIFFKPLPEKMPDSQNDTQQIIELGRKLFFERNISLTRTQSCNDCHQLDHQRSGVDHLPTAKGASGISGKRNVPTVLNAGFQTAQFWDGRADDLVEQAKGPLLNPIEMAMRTEEDIVSRLMNSHYYPEAFERAFPNQAKPLTFDNMAQAIAAFERTLVTPSRFDHYLKGDAKALSESEHVGLERFIETGCIDCHSSHPVGGRLMRKLGVYHPYENQSDKGRYEITGREEDKFVFKACMLRNVTLTGPYFHDGRVSTLSEAVRLMAWMQLNTELSATAIDQIVCFLRTLEAEYPTNF
jgi:cytochrome c peroxidase